MKHVTPSDSIDVQALRVGMFVHLDGGWMSHPFPLSNFKIATAAQIMTIRSLGLTRVRWSPQQSDFMAPMPGQDEPPQLRTSTGASADLADTQPGARLADPATVDDGAAGARAAPVVPTSTGLAAAAATAVALALQAKAEHRHQLGLQRAALKLCERQFTEATRACKQATELVTSRPQEARLQSEALTQALLDKLIGDGEICVRVLSEAAGCKAPAHALNVTVISLLMGRCFGFSQSDLLDLGVGALLHDIGKVDLPSRLRHAEDSFSANETLAYEEHVVIGLSMARKMGLSAGAATVIAQHHEHADGSGFPARLNSDRVSVASRIVALVNRYDNLCNPHIAARALTPHESVSLLFSQGKSKFDTSILGAFIKMMGVYPPGSTVQLTDDRYATVVSVNSSQPLKPTVLLYDAAVPREDALTLDLEAVAGLGIRRSIRPTQLPPPALAYLAPAQRLAYFFEPARRSSQRA